MNKKTALVRPTSSSKLIAELNEEFGQGAAMTLASADVDVEVISTGIPSLDIALVAGGLPRGRVVEIFGPESSGKTTLALYTILSAQRMGGTCMFIDAEHALDPAYASMIGVDIDSLILSQPDSAEQALEICDMACKSASLDVIVVDSVAALVPRAEIEGDMGDAHVGLQARLMSQALRKLTNTLQNSYSPTVLIFINQLREKIGVMFGNPETQPGGRALKFYASVRIDTRAHVGDRIKVDDQIVGVRIKAKVVKNKIGPPFRTAEFDLMYEKGISIVGSLLDIAEDLDIVKKSGAWYYDSNGEKLAQGRPKTIALLESNPDRLETLAVKLGWDV